MLCQMRSTQHSVIAPLHAQLLHDTQRNLADPPSVKELKEAIHQDLRKRYASELEKNTLASTIDPRFKSLAFLSDGTQDTFANLVTEAASTVESQLNIIIIIMHCLMCLSS